jgi:hypothetical protein
VAVEGADDALGLVEVRALRAVRDHADRAAQSQLERDVAQRERLPVPVDQCDRAGHVEAVTAPRLSRAGVDEPRLDVLARRRRHAAHRGRVDAIADGVERGAQETPAVDGHLLDRHVSQAAVAHRARGVLRHLAILRGARRAEAERARADRGQPLDGRAQALRVDRQLAGECKRVVRFRLRAHRADPR